MDKCTGYCGIDCTKCPGYIAFKNNDDQLRIKTAQEWSKQYNHEFSKDMINCTGCASKEEPHCGYCGICKVRACAQKKSVSRCTLCKDFENCKTRQEFEKMAGFNMKDKP
jgi:hypothetical protein